MNYMDQWKNDNLVDFHDDLEHSVHGYTHVIIGGAWSCGDEDNSIIDKYFTFNSNEQDVLNTVVNIIPWSKLWVLEYLQCPIQCDEDTSFDECRCACPTLEEAEFVIDTAIKTKLEQHSVSDEATFELEDDVEYSWLIELLCSPGQMGDAATTTSPYDPFFWIMHQSLERIWNWVEIYQSGTFDSTWVDTGITGRDYDDVLPFSNLFGENDPDTYYTNKNLYDLFQADNPSLPYVYESYEWSHCIEGYGELPGK